jgi:hypothetical protein
MWIAFKTPRRFAGFGKVHCNVYYDKEDADYYVEYSLKKGIHVTLLPFEHAPFNEDNKRVDEIDDTKHDEFHTSAWLVFVKQWVGEYWLGGILYEKHEDAVSKTPQYMDGIFRQQIEFPLCSDSETVGRTPPPSPPQTKFHPGFLRYMLDLSSPSV